LPGTDSMAQALGGIAQAYATPGQPLKTGIVSVADETCAILAFGGALAALTYARTTGLGQRVDCSLLGGQSRRLGWTLHTEVGGKAATRRHRRRADQHAARRLE